ncbi:MAG: PP0621 family protein [Inhella sp.]|uniref:PP0621 family protein n=1 Tax=Inhella sp. TaxID=1921806 RepID=UPI00345BB2E1
MLLRVLLVLAALVVLFVWWSRRRPPAAPPSPHAASAPQPDREAMVRCPHCGVHTPVSMGWPGRGGTYCSAEHRAIHEPTEPPAP